VKGADSPIEAQTDLGGSYGGLHDARPASRGPRLFAAGATSSRHRTRDLLRPGRAHGWPHLHHGIGDPATEKDLLYQLSPPQARKVKAPLLVLHGANDTNVPLEERSRWRRSWIEEAGSAGDGLAIFRTEGTVSQDANRVRSKVEIVKCFEKVPEAVSLESGNQE